MTTDIDLDGDGLLNASDPFALDFVNGSNIVLSAGTKRLLDFVIPGPGTPYDAGFTGLMTVPGAANGPVDESRDDVTFGPSGLTIAAVGGGDSYQGRNTLTHGYQFGVDVGGVATFVAGTRILNPFEDFTPQNYQAQGLQIGTGSQDTYIKLAFMAAGGSGGIEVLWESGGVVSYRKTYALDLPAGIALSDVAHVELDLEVRSGSGAPLVTPLWRLFDASGALVHDQTGNAVLSFAVSGAIADAIAGNHTVDGVASGLAVGLYATSAGATPFEATWENLGISGSLPPDGDYDGDGITNGLDPFALDAANGAGNVIDAANGLLLEFAELGAGTGATPFAAGLTGVNLVPIASANLPVPVGAIVTETGLTVSAVASGDSYKGMNTMTHGYQVGIDVSGVPAFHAHTVMVNPFRDFVPQNYQAQGLQIGAGDQDHYIKVAIVANGGAGGIEFLWENGGSVDYRKLYAVDLPLGTTLSDVASIDIGFEVDSSSGTVFVTPTWRLLGPNGGVLDDQSDASVASIAVSGPVAAAILGDLSIGGAPVGTAVGLYATSAGATPFEATWKTLAVEASEGFDYDSDGLVNGRDPFVADAANGFTHVVDETSSLHLDFTAIATSAGGMLSPHEAGLSGVMTIPTPSSDAFAFLPSGAVVTTKGLIVAAVEAGDAYQSHNDLTDGYQVGVDVSAAVTFVARTTMVNPFRDTAPQGYQAQGLQIGTGDQDHYLKIAFVAKGGAGGIEVLWENDGALAFRQSFTLDLPAGTTLADVARIEVGLHVDSSTGETIVTPEWRLLGDAGELIDSAAGDAVQPIILTGEIADAIAGTHETGGTPTALAAGLYATSAAAAPFEAIWETLDVQYAAPDVPDYAFSQLVLNGTAGLANPTSLQFGPDGRLYVAERFGGIWSYAVEKTASGYSVTDAQRIDLIENIPNHDDLGNLTSVAGRQTTGLLVTGTAEKPILYVSSSNPIVGGGPAGLDKNLDTNSGILSRLTSTGTEWEKLDLVRGLPRSEENHSVNGMILDGDTLYLTVAGNTNQGSPSSKFAYLSEYALSSAILTIDLAQLDAMPIQGAGSAHPYVYDLPTLDDPTVANIDTDGDGIPDDDPNGVFGGHDGLNMATIIDGGPVGIFSTGYRNPYDIVMTEDHRIYVTDNGGNATWGGVPLYDPGGLATNEPNPDENSVSKDSLHLVTAGSHGGHANPTRGNTAGAGLYVGDDGGPGWLTDPAELPVDWFDRNGGLEFLLDNVSKKPVVDGEGRPIPGADGDGSLWAFTASTNGLTEYTATEFDGALAGYLIAASYDGRVVFIERDATGTSVESVDYLQVLLGNTVPLDVTAQGNADPFPGTVWVANIGSSQIVVLEPAEPGSVIIDPTIASDTDQDGIANLSDAFMRDPNNGMATTFSAGETIVWDFARDALNPPPLGGVSIFGLGFTGVMYNGITQPDTLYDPDNILPSGANPVFQVNYVSEGEAHGGHNTQENAFQFGVSFDATVETARISATIDNPFDSTTPAKYQSQGIYIGTGSQFDYVSISVAQHLGGSIEVKQEIDDVIVHKVLYAIPDLFDTTDVVLSLDVDTETGAIRPFWTYTLHGQSYVGEGETFFAAGNTLSAIHGTYSQEKDIPGFTGEVASGLAVGIIATSVGPAEEFTASWANISVSGLAGDTSPTAFLGVTLKNVIDTSTFTSNSFELVNLPESGADLVSMTIDTSTAVLPQIVFDPLGTAGDTGTPKPFTVDSSVGSFTTEAAYEGALDGGFQVLRLSFDDFDPGESLGFSIDIDPSNIKGAAPPGPQDTGSISGLELIGSTVTLAFADGTTQTMRISKDPGKLAGASAVFKDDMPGAPVVDVAGLTSGDATINAVQTVLVTATPGSTVRIIVAEGGLYLDGIGAGAPPAAGANTFLAVREYDVVTGADGSAAADVVLSDADGASGVDTGWNYIVASEIDDDAIFDGEPHLGATSTPFLLRYDSSDLLAF